MCKKNVLLIWPVFIILFASAQNKLASEKGFSFAGNSENKIAGNLYSPQKPLPIRTGLASFLMSSSFFENVVTKKIVSDTAEIKSETAKINFRPTLFSYPVNSKTDQGIPDYSTDELLLYARSLKEYAKQNGYDTGYAFLCNMGMLSKTKRFFVVNLTTMQIEQAGLVTHGRGQGPTIYDRQYSDEPKSRCTSLGRYKILNKYNGGYGESYRLMGLDSGNHNAYSRNIVLHSMSCIPDVENLFPSCVSDGCPSVSSKFLAFLSKIIDSRKNPMLLWIFDSNLMEVIVEK